MYDITSNRSTYHFTSESVSEGHPDKVCDQISDAILDLYLKQDPYSRVACEVLATTNRLVIAGEVRGPESITPEMIEQTARDVVKDIGYEQEGFHWNDIEVDVLLHQQSAEIAQGVDEGDDKEEGAGDQGIMFGFACRETDLTEPGRLMPAPIHYSHRILKELSDARRSGKQPELEPDAKAQVTMEYENGVPARTTSIVVSTQHKAGLSQQDVRAIVRPYIEKALPDGWMCPEGHLYINPTGSFVVGGPDGDAGLTGRKIIVDTYGGAAPHGGGAFSGKDPTKVDRSAAYAARYLAKNVVAAGLADRCMIQISYAIGVSHPLSFYVTTQGSNRVSEERLEQLLPQLMDLSPRGIREHLKLNKAIFQPTASYGHFGRLPRENGAFSWERLDLVDTLKSEFGVKEAVQA